MLRRRRRRWTSDEKDPEINMTPMIDCVFQLLIFFMVGTHFHTDDAMLAAHLPKYGVDSRRAVDPPLESVRIRLDYGGPGRTACAVNHQPVAFDTRGDPAGRVLAARLGEMLRAGGVPIPATIDAGFQVPTGDVVCALNAAIAAGFRQVNFAVPGTLRRAAGIRP